MTDRSQSEMTSRRVVMSVFSADSDDEDIRKMTLQVRSMFVRSVGVRKCTC